MRYLIDTNIFVYMASDPEYLNRDIDAIIQEPETLLYISAESVRELIVAYRNKGLCSKRWKSAEAMIVAIEKEFYVKILPLKKEHMQTYAHMEINEAQGHKDPSDHVIIAHAITEHLPLISSDTRFGFYRSQGLDLVFNQKYSVPAVFFFIIVYVRIAFVRVVEVKYSKTLSAYLFYSFFCKKIGRCVLCTHLLNLFNVNK